MSWDFKTLLERSATDSTRTDDKVKERESECGGQCRSVSVCVCVCKSVRVCPIECVSMGACQ